MDELLTLLKSEFGIVPHSIFPVAGGFSAKAAYRVAGADGTEYFLKVYDKSLPTTRRVVERIDLYMPVLDRLAASANLRGRVLTPVPARCGAYKAETDSDVYVPFIYVRGETPGIQGMTRAQTRELAEILALLHDAGEAVPPVTSGLAEDISLSFCEQLARFLNKPDTKHRALFELISPHAGLLQAAICEIMRLRDTVRLGYAPLVLCHGDAHGNNVIQGERLVLADWEDLCIALAEADLFIYAWHPHGHILLEAYAAARRGYRINHEMLYFYILRRRIEDVWFNVQRLAEETPDEAETAKLLDWTRRGIEEVQSVYREKR
jgi:Ser/Thr protein kinase RdoA (MazF antagonist)